MRAVVMTAAGGPEFGHLSVQIARLAGARVGATVSPGPKAELAASLGAELCIEYTRRAGGGAAAGPGDPGHAAAGVYASTQLLSRCCPPRGDNPCPSYSCTASRRPPRSGPRCWRSWAAITLSPPGFGALVPDGFGATSDEYLAWLTGELAELSGPVDLIGHDWGAGHVSRVAATRPDLIRSWCIDLAGIFDPEYVWHDLAQAWQTPEVGEQTVSAMFSGSVDELAAGYVGLGMTPEVARACAEAGGPELAHRNAERFGAQEVVLDGLGHWWMLQDPARGAAALAGFLGGLDG